MKLPPRSPNWNPHAERFVRTIKESCLDRLILFGEGSRRKVIHEFMAHYHHERNHQGLGNRLIIPDKSHAGDGREVRCRERLRWGAELRLSAGSLTDEISRADQTVAVC